MGQSTSTSGNDSGAEFRLANLRSKLLKLSSIEDMASNCDKVTYDNRNNVIFNVRQLSFFSSDEDILDPIYLNMTSWGNVARLVVSSPEEYREQWKDILKRMITYNSIELNFDV